MASTRWRKSKHENARDATNIATNDVRVVQEKPFVQTVRVIEARASHIYPLNFLCDICSITISVVQFVKSSQDLHERKNGSNFFITLQAENYDKTQNIIIKLRLNVCDMPAFVIFSAIAKCHPEMQCFVSSNHFLFALTISLYISN